MGKHMAAYARGRQPRCMSAAACVPATCERRCAQACVLPKCVPRTANACGSCRRTRSGTHTGWPEAHISAQASARARADAWGGKPAAGSTTAQEKRLGAKRGEGRHERGRVGGSAGTSAPAQMSAPVRAGVPAAGTHPGVRRRPPHPRGYAHIAQAQVTDLAPPTHPPSSAEGCVQRHHGQGAGPASWAGSAASHHRSLAMNLCSGAACECCSLLPFSVSAPITGATLEV